MIIKTMTIKIMCILVSMCVMLSACKVLKTHVVKLTGSVKVDGDRMYVPTHVGRVYFSAQSITEQQKQLLQNLRPYQCLQIKTPEQFSMDHREVTFYDFKLKSLLESQQDCRKIKLRTRIEVH